MSKDSDNNSPGLYVHVPFCQSKCPYCDFYSITTPDLIPAYLEALEKEAQLYSAKMPSEGGTGFPACAAQAKACGYTNTPFASFDSLYLGGGTPSLLDEAQLSALVQCLRRHFSFAPDTEFTLEANPDDVTAAKLRLWRELGVNRLSLGAQSFDEAGIAFPATAAHRPADADGHCLNSGGGFRQSGVRFDVRPAGTEPGGLD